MKISEFALRSFELIYNTNQVEPPYDEIYYPNMNVIKQALEKLKVIEFLVDKKRFNTDDIELLRESILEVLEQGESYDALSDDEEAEQPTCYPREREHE